MSVVPSSRCRQTADILNVNSRIVYTDARLSEFTGDRNVHGEYDFITRNDAPIPTSKYETYAQFVSRIESALDFIVSHIPGNILIVTHGLVVKHFDDKYGYHRYSRGRDVPYMTGLTLEYSS